MDESPYEREARRELMTWSDNKRLPKRGNHWIISKSLARYAPKFELCDSSWIIKKNKSYWIVVSDEYYAECVKLSPDDLARKFEIEQENQNSPLGPARIMDRFLTGALLVLVGAIVLFIIWRVAVGVSAVGQMQSSPGDSACEQLGGRASGDRCVFR